MANTYLINIPSVLLYTKPDLSAPIADEAVYGMECKVIEEYDEFYKVRMFYGYEAFVQKNALCVGVMPDCIVCTKFADLLPTPDYSLAPALTLPVGARIKLRNATGGRFEKVITNEGNEFYTHKNNIKKYNKTSLRNLRQRLKDTSMMFLGTQYRWGGKTASGIDCSGLIFMCYYLNGYEIYRDAQVEKFSNFVEIPLHEAKMGDLLFFPKHIALYIGSGCFIHSTGAYGGVTINSFDTHSSIYSPYHRKNFNKAMSMRALVEYENEH